MNCACFFILSDNPDCPVHGIPALLREDEPDPPVASAPEPTTNDAAPVTEDELAEVERLHADLAPFDVRDLRGYSPDFVRMNELARTLLPRLARDLRKKQTDLRTLRGAIERVTMQTGTAEQLTADLAATVEALAKKIADHDEQDALVSRDHQRLEDRAVQAEAERDRARAVAAQAEALMQDRERLTQQVRDFKDATRDIVADATGYVPGHVAVQAHLIDALERIARRDEDGGPW